MTRSICPALAVVMALTTAFPAQPKSSLIEQAGDKIQIILPVAALVCSFGLRDIGNFTVRYLVNMGITHGSKNALGDTPINLRPSGSDRGFPSGHAAAAFQGASYLARDCVGATPWGKIAVFGAAVFVGGSRLEAGAHFLVQVLAGALVGTLSDRLFRKNRRPTKEPNRWRVVAGRVRNRLGLRQSGP